MQTIAGTCAKIASTDASIDSSPPRDAPLVDAIPDGPALVKLWIRIDGRGVVNIPTVGTCDGSPGEALCLFDVQRGALVTLNAQPKNNWRFDRWEDACDGAPTPTCVLAPEEDTQARVRFEMNDDLL